MVAGLGLDMEHKDKEPRDGDRGGARPAEPGRVVRFRGSADAHARRLADLKQRIEDGDYQPDPEVIVQELLQALPDLAE